jgi:Rps23 Pro-64 3,4-dihydroxylase Tpa1-like proline 4-hydroxylase
MNATTLTIINPRIFEPTTFAKLKQDYLTAQPYKHVVIDNFLNPDFADILCDRFPLLSQMKTHYKGLNENKAEDANFQAYDEAFRQLKAEYRSPEFIKFLEDLTDIKGLSMPDDALGCGTHQGDNGSYLDIHVDFNIHPSQDLHRRLNVLLFLNRDWKEDYGGKLEMWDSAMTRCVTSHLPILNRLVIFETNEISYHGYDRITVPEGVTRKSIYAYFYTKASETAKHLTYHDTIFRARPTESTAKKLKTTLKEAVKNFIKRHMKNMGVIQLYYDTLFNVKNRKR